MRRNANPKGCPDPSNGGGAPRVAVVGWRVAVGSGRNPSKTECGAEWRSSWQRIGDARAPSAPSVARPDPLTQPFTCTRTRTRTRTRPSAGTPPTRPSARWPKMVGVRTAIAMQQALNGVDTQGHPAAVGLFSRRLRHVTGAVLAAAQATPGPQRAAAPSLPAAVFRSARRAPVKRLAQ